jgi:hypothetical protein
LLQLGPRRESHWLLFTGAAGTGSQSRAAEIAGVGSFDNIPPLGVSATVDGPYNEPGVVHIAPTIGPRRESRASLAWLLFNGTAGTGSQLEQWRLSALVPLVIYLPWVRARRPMHAHTDPRVAGMHIGPRRESLRWPGRYLIVQRVMGHN